MLHVIPSVDERSGGPATAIVPMCRALMQQGIDVLLLSTTAGLPAEMMHGRGFGIQGCACDLLSGATGRVVQILAAPLVMAALEYS